MKTNEKMVLSFSRDPDSLVRREAALRSGGFEVISVKTESHARFEIEMGRCGVLVICYRVTAATVQDLTRLFRRSCPTGSIVFVMNRTDDGAPGDVDYKVPDSEGPEAIVQSLRSGLHSESKAS
jgi:hypothetical protein